MILKEWHKSRVSRTLFLLTPEEAQEWRSKLNELQAECGCKAGAVFMILGMSAWVTYRLGSTITHTRTFTIVECAGVLFASAIIGKILGLLVAEIRLQVALRRLEHIIRTKPGVHDKDDSIKAHVDSSI